MTAWIEFAAVVAFITVMGWLLWSDMGELYDYAQREVLLDTLWDEDGVPGAVTLEVVPATGRAE